MFMQEGAVFENNICNTSPCGPSRASLFSGMFPANNGVTNNFGTISPSQMNFANILNEQGYDVHYMGKLHMRDEFTTFSTQWKELPPEEATATAFDENAILNNSYGLKSWTAPDFGTMLVQGEDLSSDELANLAGGKGNNDSRVILGEGDIAPNERSVQEVLEHLQSNKQKNPFCLVISLLNPHDVSLYPFGWNKAGYEDFDFNAPQFKNFQLPVSYNDTLDDKPNVQAAYLNTDCFGKLLDNPDNLNALDYVKFYAHLHELSDRLFGLIYKQIKPETHKNTILIRMADHGEMGMAHGGLQEKNFSMYKEMINVPMIWKHPSIPSGKRPQMVGLIDLVPTIGALVHADLSCYPQLQGQNYSKALFDKNYELDSDEILYNYPTTPSGSSKPIPEAPVTPEGTFEQNPNADKDPSQYPGNIYAYVKEDFKFAIYYSANSYGMVDWSTAQFESYNLINDKDEMINLIPRPKDGEDYSKEQLERITQGYTNLTRLMKKKEIVMPGGWDTFLTSLSNLNQS